MLKNQVYKGTIAVSAQEETRVGWNNIFVKLEVDCSNIVQNFYKVTKK